MKDPAPNNDLFRVGDLSHQEGTITVNVYINEHSYIFKGHFPGRPVVPGACMLQLVKDILESAMHTALRLIKADHLKFMRMIEPATTQIIQLKLIYLTADETSFNVTASFSADDNTCFKFRGVFIKS